MNDPFLALSEQETLGLYLLLKEAGAGDGSGAPDATLLRLLNRIEKLLYERLTIQELENIEQVYRKTTHTEKEGKR